MDKMLCLFYCMLFPVRALKNGNPGRRGVLELGKLGGREGSSSVGNPVRSGGGGDACHLLGECIFSGITQSNKMVANRGRHSDSLLPLSLGAEWSYLFTTLLELLESALNQF